MPSFGVPSSMPPPGSSSLSSCIATLASSNTTNSDPETVNQVPDGCMSHFFGAPHLPPPPPLSLSDSTPYSPPPAYPPVFPFGPPLLPSARFPPPPNPSFARPVSNITFFEGTHYPPEPLTAYDRWSEGNVNSATPYGGDHLPPKSFNHWGLPTFNSGMSGNGNNNNNNSNHSSGSNPSMGFPKPEPFFPSIGSYQPVDSGNFGPKFSPLPGFPNAGMHHTLTSTSLTPPLASSHFGAFPPPNLPLDFPHSSNRFPFNPNASPFLPGMDPPSPFGVGAAEFMPEPVPSYLSRHGPYQPSSSFGAHDHFYDNSPSLPIPSTEAATPRPVSVDTPTPSSFFCPPPQPFHSSSDFLSRAFSPRSEVNDSNLLGSSEGAPPVLDFSSGFPTSFTLPYPPPHPGCLFSPYAPISSQYQELPRSGGSSSGPKKREEDKIDRIVAETGKLMFQHLSPEEWRWKHYEPAFADALEPSGIDTRVRPSGFNNFYGVDSIVYSAIPNSSSGIVLTEEGFTSGASKSRIDQEENLDRFITQNQSGPSLKLAASRLAEMLALGSNGASSATSRSMLSQVEASSETAVTVDGAGQLANSKSGGQTRAQQVLEDCCSSSGSDNVEKEGRDASSPVIRESSTSLIREFERLTAAEEERYLSGLTLGLPTRGKREVSELPEDAFCDYGGPVEWVRAKASEKMPDDGSCDSVGAGAWARAKASGKIETSTTSRPVSWVETVPPSAKGGPMTSSGQRRVFSEGSAGIMRQPSAATGSPKIHEADVDCNDIMEAYNFLFPRSSELTSMSQSGSVLRNVSSPGAEVLPSDCAPSVIGPFASTVTATSGLSLFGPHQELPGEPSTKLPLDSSSNDQWHVNSTSCGSSPPLSQAYLDQQRSVSGSLPTVGAAPRPFTLWAPESASQTEVTYMGTSFHSLAASIANLSKVLFSLDSSALTPPDSALLEENLQSSILRLSECLLLEQSRTNKDHATRFVGSDKSSASRQGRVDGSLRDIDPGRHGDSGGSTNLGHLKASDFGILPNVSRSGSPTQRCNVNDLRNSGTVAPVESVDSLSSQRLFPLRNDSHGVSKCAMNDGGVRAGKTPRPGYYDYSKRPTSSQETGATVGDDILQLLRVNDILERSSLERLIGAEEREAKLKVLVEELREELELERVENRGTALLCEKIMQETEVSKGKAVVQGAQKAVHLESMTGNRSADKSVKIETTRFYGQQYEPEEEADSEVEVKNSEELNEVDDIGSRLALLRQDREAVARRNATEDNVLDYSDQGGSEEPARLAQTAGNVPLNGPDATSGSVASRLALLLARASARCESSHDEDGDRDCLVTESATQGTTSLDGVEARLALLHGRPDWDNEVGVFTETEPCTPLKPPPQDFESDRASLSEPAVAGVMTEGRAAFATKALKAMSHITAQLLIQSETISNMHTAWSQLSEQVNSKSFEKDSNPQLHPLETDPESSNAALHPYDGILDLVEARALQIRSRPDWTEGDESESESEDFLGGQVCKVPSANPGCVRYESDQFETMNEISVVRLLDSDSEVPQPLQAAKMSANCSSPQGAIRDNGTPELSLLEKEHLALAEDAEDESGWEHVRFPSRDSE